MKVMVIVKATTSSEAGQMPSEALLTAMGQFNEELVKAGIMQSGDGLKPSSEGVRIRFKGKDRIITEGPFTETNELVAGYWVWNVESMEEAIEWVKKCPNPMEEESDIEIRTFYEMDDFAEADPSGKIREQEAGLRSQVAMKQATINNYLFFPGDTEDALQYYQRHLGATIDLLMRFSDSPEPIPEGMVPEGYENKVMHCEFTIGDCKIMASDGCGGEVRTADRGFSLALTIPCEDEARRVFNALADGGEIQMPLDKTFWSPLFGQVKDKFGIAWMVMLPSPEEL